MTKIFYIIMGLGVILCMIMLGVYCSSDEKVDNKYGMVKMCFTNTMEHTNDVQHRIRCPEE